MRRPKGKQSVTIAPFSAQDALGAKTYGTAATVKCFINYVEKNIKDFDNNEFITSAVIRIPGTSTVTRQDKITLPNGESPYIGSISQKTNYRLNRTSYTEIWVGRIAAGESRT
jgi:hypothetical protein